MKRAVFLLLVGSIVLNAALGIYALLAGEFGDVEERVLLTSLSVSAAGVLALACAPAWERGAVRPLPQAGTAAALAGFALVVAVIWAEAPPEALEKLAFTFVVVAVLAADLSLLALTRLAPRFRRTLPAAVASGLVLAAMIVSAIWGEWEGDSLFYRALGVVAVLLAAFTLLVPIFHRASRAELAAAAPGAGEAAVRHCPRCGRPLAAEAEEETVCPACGARFSVHFTARAP